MNNVLVVVPTYDEAENLPVVVAAVQRHQPHVDILVVDDNSPDGTGAVADELAADPRVNVLHRPGKQGLGAAYVEGFTWGLARGYDVLVEMDADGSHDPVHLGELLSTIADGADLVLGSRWVPGGRVVNWPRRRMALSRGGNLYTRLALRMAVRDATGGYRAYRRTALESIGLDRIASQGYCFQVDMVRRAVAAGLTVREVPITFAERTRGTSKMSGDIVREALWRVTIWGAQLRLARLRALGRRLAS